MRAFVETIFIIELFLLHLFVILSFNFFIALTYIHKTLPKTIYNNPINFIILYVAYI